MSTKTFSLTLVYCQSIYEKLLSDSRFTKIGSFIILGVTWRAAILAIKLFLKSMWGSSTPFYSTTIKLYFVVLLYSLPKNNFLEELFFPELILLIAKIINFKINLLCIFQNIEIN